MNTRGTAVLPAPDVLIQVGAGPSPARFAGGLYRAADIATKRASSGHSGSLAEGRPAHTGGGSDAAQTTASARLSDRYSRQIALFSVAGQQRLRDASVVLIGLSGLGSHLAQQLAYLGVQRYTLLDGDTVHDSSLNCLIGGTGDDVGIHKAHVAARLIRSIQPAAEVRVVAEPVPHPAAEAAIATATAVLAGIGKDTVRLILTDMCSIAGVPYVDAAADIRRAVGGDVVYGGRVVVAGPGAGCLFCRGELDRREIADQVVSPHDRQAGAASYGEGAAALGASVVTINGVIASLAATEITCLISGLRQPCGMLTYRAHQGIVTRAGDVPPRHCPFCARWAASRRQIIPDDG